ncbi:GNAT family N-acetyltransferase [Amycolatopsis albispora]|uniref:Acetyltransferase n=1 Tax=Amycolatopsis albispora TaxID=1804986 RepID=A0A344L0Y5_9PSEU|nr:GNAT family N-acetyltransferase [Amycolatopsis albispora]AXB41709.1 acetyltransferase [Amycolatopsis albispora]
MTQRVVLRKARDADRDGLVEVFTDPEVRRSLGGPRPRADVERFLDQVGAAAVAGGYVIADRETDEFTGMLGLAPRDAGQPGHVTAEGGELELSYVLRRRAWGSGVAFEAAQALLRAAAAELTEQPVLVVTQTANERARKLAARLGFDEVDTFEAHDAEQTLAVASLHSFRRAIG